VAFGPRTDVLESDVVEETAGRPSEALPVEFVEPAEEPTEQEAEPGQEIPVQSDVVEALEFIVPEGVTADEPDADQQPALEPEPVITETMAQLYTSQGLYDDAAAVYRELLVHRPDDPHLLAKLEELERPAAPPSEPAVTDLGVSATGGQTVRAMLEEVIAGVLTTRADEMAGAEGAEEPEQLSESFLEPPESSVSSESSESSEISDPVSPSDFSFDDFFGGGGQPQSLEPEPPAEPERTVRPEGLQGPESEDFKDWLKGLKT
jgi:hypothetical protein